MLAAVPSPQALARRQGAKSEKPEDWASAFETSGFERILVSGDVLLRAGDRKTQLYRVVSGLFCSHYEDAQGVQQPGGFFFIGDVIGLGGLDTHTLTVVANSAGVVQCLSRSRLLDLIDADERLAGRHADATVTEMRRMREALVGRGRTDATRRVASLLSVLADGNRREGRAAEVIGDDITCGFVADQLNLGVDGLEQALRGLSRLGLVEALPDGRLRLIDLDRLEQFAEGAGA